MEVRQYNPTFKIDMNELEFRCRHIPEHKFVEYEPSDLEWMIPLGMAPPVDVSKEAVELAKKIQDRIKRECMEGLWVPE